MLYRFASTNGFGTQSPADSELSSFSDSGNIADIYLEAMEWAVGLGIIIGTDEGTLEPESGATRAEISAMLYRFLHTANSGLF